MLRGIFESICKEVIIIPYAKPGSIKLRNLVIDSVKENPDLPIYLMAHHGVLVLGKSLSEAFNLADSAEHAFKIEYICNQWEK